ncbi:hypothetical protein [Egicoccus halophilus]|uniref:Uncharacterized protein n=1 Tax=Egicoccus halophilus TaxID=1670830 RepID=A0A8J3EW57_9ACTN|nr:hypothetical protein [Egicoccus halophilus]GGI02691.1 hypothetical protein GCM10011354_01220 [Egicoccus halophilus]
MLLASVVALAALLAGPGTPGALGAEDEPALRRAELGASVTAGFGRGTGGAVWTLLEVEFTPRVPMAGQLEIASTGSSRASDTRRVEVSAGATKVFFVLLPPADEVQAAFVADDGTRVTLPRPQLGVEDVLVGGLGAAPQLPTPLNTAALDRAVRGVRVDPAVLDLGPRALEALDALVVSAGDLRAMDDGRREDLAVAVASGLDLLVPIRAGDEALPLPWNPLASTDTDADGQLRLVAVDGAFAASAADLGGEGATTVAAATPAGRGRVVALAGAPGEGGPADDPEIWSQLLQPRVDLGGPLGNTDDGDVGNRLFGGGTTLPGIRGAIAFVLAYLLLVGPVNALVVRRAGRRELAWVTIPAITVVFTVVAALTAAGSAPTATPVTRAAWWFDGVGQEVTAMHVQAPARGVQEVVLPGARDTMIGTSWSDVASAASFDGDETTFRTRLEALQTTTAIAFGAPTAPAPLEVTATFDDGVLNVELANRTEHRLAQVRVLVATSTTEVGELGPGERRTVTVDDLEDTLARAPGDRGLRMVGEPPGREVGKRPEPDVAERLLAWGMLDRSPGAVWVTAASTDDLGLTRPRVGGELDDRGAFVAVGVTPDHAGGDVLPHEIRRDLVRNGPWSPWRQHPLSVEGEEQLLLRFRLPEPAAATTLVSTLMAGGEVQPMDHGIADPWSNGCFEVTEIDADGVASDPEEGCGPEIACPPASRECGGDDQRIEACFEDGSCQIAVRIGDDPTVEQPDTTVGFEVFDRQAQRWVALDQVFDDAGRASVDRVVSPLGEVLVRARNAGFLPFGQRGLGLEVGA